MGNNDTLSNWLDCYDILGSRYNYSLGQFLELTQRQLQIILLAADRGRHSDICQKLALAGAKDIPDYNDPRENTKELKKKKNKAIMESVEALKGFKL